LNKNELKEYSVYYNILMNMSNADIQLNNNNDNKKITKKNLGGRPTKKIRFAKERLEILQKMKNILGIDDKNHSFYLYDLENDKTKMENIMNLKDEVFEYFTSKNNSVFRKKDATSKPHVSLIKLVFKEMDIELINSTKSIKRNDKSIQTSRYFIADNK